jgi:hypothetical protein
MGYEYYERLEFNTLLGKVFTKVYMCSNNGDDEIHFETDDGEHYKLYHSQDCCESVNVEDIVGDLEDLVGNPILVAEEVSSSGRDDYDGTKEESDLGPPPEREYHAESYTWTFYKLATIKGYVDIRWFGSSNGYYSESVDLAKLK